VSDPPLRGVVDDEEGVLLGPDELQPVTRAAAATAAVTAAYRMNLGL
jgi:hypothetical protein